ncbi:hypothetical protein GKR48_14335 [Providencia sp. wls1943]|nr:hypothetical protein [Providencia sp. wls1943]
MVNSVEIDNKYIIVSRFLLRLDSVSINEVKKRANIGYNQAVLILEDLEKKGVITHGDFIDDDWLFLVNKDKLKTFLYENDPIYKTKKIECNDREIETDNRFGKFLSTSICILVGAVSLYFILIFFFNGEKKEVDYCNDEERAYLASQTIIQSKLKSPSTARFPHYSKVSITSAGLCTFQIDGYVDAQNSFGALVRDNYTTIITYDEKSQTHIQKSLNFK